MTIDVTDKTNPTFAAVFDPGFGSNLWGAIDMGITGDDLYLTSGSNTFTILNIADPLNINIKGQLSDASLQSIKYAYSVGDYAYVTSFWHNTRISVIDLTDHTAPAIAGSVSDVALECSVGIDGDANHAFVSMDVRVGVSCVGAQSGVTSVDVSNPLNPFILNNNIDGMGYSYHLRTQGNYAYLGNETLDGLLIYDISDKIILIWITRNLCM